MPRKKRKNETPPKQESSAGSAPDDAPAPAKKKFSYIPEEQAAAGSILTAREEEVVKEVAKGRENLEVALELGVDERTIEKHMKNIRRKIDAKTRTAVVSWWYERKLEQMELRLHEGK